MIKERPILFSGPMVRAILEGRKTQTRRVVKRNAPVESNGLYEWYPGGEKAGFHALSDIPDFSVPSGWAAEWCPYGKPGDRLWVRETWARCEPYPSDDSNCGPKLGMPHKPLSAELYPYWQKRVMYRAGLPDDVNPCDIIERGSADNVWRPSIFMPRWASRILLEITDVRVQRLQEISEQDAIAEGVEQFAVIPHKTAPCGLFRELWGSINGADSWGANPWVWAITFKRIDAAERAA